MPVPGSNPGTRMAAASIMRDFPAWPVSTVGSSAGGRPPWMSEVEPRIKSGDVHDETDAALVSGRRLTSDTLFQSSQQTVHNNSDLKRTNIHRSNLNIRHLRQGKCAGFSPCGRRTLVRPLARLPAKSSPTETGELGRTFDL